MKISVIITGRNDNYGGDYLDRLSLSIKSLAISFGNVDWECILVDFNQVQAAPPLSSYFKDYSNMRHIVVTKDDYLSYVQRHLDAGCKFNIAKKVKTGHKKFRLDKEEVEPSYVFGDYENILCGCALNEGIKYACGDFILTTSSDNIFSYGLGENLTRVLRPGVVYRAKALFTSCDTPIIDRNFENLLRLRNIDDITLENKPSLFRACGDFMLFEKQSAINAGGFYTIPQPGAYGSDCGFLYNLAIKGCKLYGLNYTFTNIVRPSTMKVLNSINYSVDTPYFSYSHDKEFCSSDWLTFKNIVRTSYFDSEHDISVSVSDESECRLEYIKNGFKCISDRFVIY
jgi:glycosyltransferase involved in cell wall biosynthesis